MSDKPAREPERKAIAKAIVTRVAERAVLMAITRWGLVPDDSDVDFDENDCARDIVGVALGEDTGCLGDDQITAENIDLMFVEEQLSRLANLR